MSDWHPYGREMKVIKTMSPQHSSNFKGVHTVADSTLTPSLLGVLPPIPLVSIVVERYKMSNGHPVRDVVVVQSSGRKEMPISL